MEEQTKAGALLDVILTNKKQLVRDMKAAGSLGCSDQDIVEFRILRKEQNKQTNKQNCYSELQEKRLWTGQGVAWKSPTGHGPREECKSWLIFRYHLFPSSGTVRLKSKRSSKARGQ